MFVNKYLVQSYSVNRSGFDAVFVRDIGRPVFYPNAGCHFFRYLRGIEYQYTEKQYLWIGSIRNNMYM